LWAIQAETTNATSYVFGTMHVKDQRVFHFKDQVFEKIESCDAFATEINLEEANHNLSADALDLPPGQSLENLLTKKQYEKVKKCLHKMTGLDLDFFQQSLPILITNMLADRVLSKDMPDSLDQSLWNYAKSLGKITLGIETLEEQVVTMKKIPLDYQIRSLVHASKNPRLFRKQTLKMAQLYETADIQKIFRSAKKSSGEIRKIILYDRNQVIADRIALLAASFGWEKRGFADAEKQKNQGKAGKPKILDILKLAIRVTFGNFQTFYYWCIFGSIYYWRTLKVNESNKTLHFSSTVFLPGTTSASWTRDLYHQWLYQRCCNW